MNKANGDMCAASATNLPLGPAAQERLLRERLSAIRHTVFVTSGKGGVGKSSVTVNLAVALADQGWRVGVLDADFHGPSIVNMLGLQDRCLATGPHSIVPLQYGDRLRVMSMDGLLECRDDPVMWRGPQKTSAIRQFLRDVEWGPLDVLLIDSPPGTTDEHMTVLSTLPRAWCVLVTTPQEISLADVRKAAGYLHRVKARILGLVENMSGLSCPHCGREIDVFRKGGGRLLAEDRNIPFLGAIPLDVAAVVASDRGEPVVRLEASEAREAFLALAGRIRARLEQD